MPLVFFFFFPSSHKSAAVRASVQTYSTQPAYGSHPKPKLAKCSLTRFLYRDGVSLVEAVPSLERFPLFSVHHICSTRQRSTPPWILISSGFQYNILLQHLSFLFGFSTSRISNSVHELISIHMSSGSPVLTSIAIAWPYCFTTFVSVTHWPTEGQAY